jgi:ubiquitin-conjugating enzyme E2 J2
MASKACVNRLQKEYRALLKVRQLQECSETSEQLHRCASCREWYYATCQEPLPHIKAQPSPTNLLDWHYALEGVKGTPFEGGVYHGCVLGLDVALHL